jgi:hypothetical protein
VRPAYFRACRQRRKPGDRAGPPGRHAARRRPAHKLQKGIAAALEQAPRPSTVVRRYRRDPAPLVRNADGSWRTGRLDAVLRGDFDLLAADEGGGTE